MKTKTPVYDFVTDYLNKDMSRFHMPGHKGMGALGCEGRDITEIAGADYLLDPSGIIAESEMNASSLFATACTLYSTEGSTLAMKAMLRVAMMCTERQRNGRRFRILAGRNAHASFIHACALLDFDTEWLYGEDTGSFISCRITPEGLCNVLDGMKEKPDAVYITSPDYMGNMTDIHGLAETCHSRGILLLADNAHGAYLHFLDDPVHPIDLGADMCCDSAHKTLPVLTGGAYLHISQRMEEMYGNLYHSAKKAMSLFASTSPSYLILQSLDLCNTCLSDGFREELKQTCIRVSRLKEELDQAGIAASLNEPLKLVIDCAALGMSGSEMAEYLQRNRIECEYADIHELVLMITPKNKNRDLTRLKKALTSLAGKRPVLKREYPVLPLPQKVCSIRQAVFAPSVRIPIKEAEGRICAAPSVSCPPAVPVAVSGELLTNEILDVMKWYGISDIEVIDD